MQVVYSLTEADLREAAYRRDRQKVRLLRLAAAAMVAAMVFGAGFPVPGGLTLVAGSGLAFLPVAQRGRKLWTVPDFDLTPRRLTFDNRGILLETDLASEAYPWRAVRRLVRTRHLAIFELTDDEMIVAPLAAFGEMRGPVLKKARLAMAATRGEL